MSEITHHRQLSVNILNFLFIFLRFLIDFHPIFFVQLFACQACIENDANKTSLSNVQKREPAPRMHNYCIVKWNTHTHTQKWSASFQTYLYACVPLPLYVCECWSFYLWFWNEFGMSISMKFLCRRDSIQLWIDLCTFWNSQIVINSIFRLFILCA